MHIHIYFNDKLASEYLGYSVLQLDQSTYICMQRGKINLILPISVELRCRNKSVKRDLNLKKGNIWVND